MVDQPQPQVPPGQGTNWEVAVVNITVEFNTPVVVPDGWEPVGGGVQGSSAYLILKSPR